MAELAFGGREQSTGEEIANTVSHAIGFVAAVAAIPILVVAAVRNGGAAAVVGASIFAATMAALYLISTLFHALPRNRAKHVLQRLDHAAIFLLIAGTYTPFTLGVLGGAWGWTLFGLVWGLALAGILLKAVRGTRHPKLSMSLYLGIGWLALIAAEPLWLAVPAWGIFWLLAGGIAYTVGAGFYSAERIRYNHFVWHLFVMAGSGCHFIAVLLYAV